MNRLFVESINNNDLQSVRLFLSNELLLDPRGINFDEMLACAEQRCVNLYEVNDCSFPIEKDSNRWDKQYLNELKNTLDNHFHKDLLLHYRQVTSVVLNEKIQALNLEEQKDRETIPPIKKYSFEKVACGTLLVSGASFVTAGMVKVGVACLIASACLGYKILKK